MPEGRYTEEEFNVDELLREPTEHPDREAPKQPEKQLSAEEWVTEVQKQLKEILAKQKAFQEQVGAKAASSAQTVPTDAREIRALVEALDIEDVHKLLEQLQSLRRDTPSDTRVAEQFVVYERQLESVAAEREATRRHTESAARVAESTSLQRQVFENFTGFLNQDAEVHYGGDKFEVRVIDGKYVITVPEPTFDNMLELAQVMSGKFGENYGSSPEDFAQQLIDAAILMDQQAIFSADVIESMYNAGKRLQKILNGAPFNPATDRVSLRAIQQDSRALLSNMDPKEKEAMKKRLDQVYLKIFLGKRDVQFFTDSSGAIHIRNVDEKGKIRPRTLYEAIFERFTKSDEGKEWLSKNGYTRGELNKERILEAYDKWLCEPKRQYELMHKLKKYIEMKATSGGETKARLGVMVSKWRHMLLDTRAAKEISSDIESRIKPGMSDVEKLQQITSLFQPGESLEQLRYLPSDVLRLFQQDGSAGQRNEAACIIADSYVKHFLEAQGFRVFTHLRINDDGASAHTKLIAVNPKTGEAYYVDPNVSKGQKDAKGRDIAAVEKITDPKILAELRKGADERQVTFRTEDNAVIASGDALLTSGFITNMIGVQKLQGNVAFAAAERAVQLAPENPVAWLRLAQASANNPQKQQEYLRQANNLDPRITQASLSKDMLIGALNIPPTGEPAIDNIIQQANAWIAASQNPAGGLEVLNENQLQALEVMFKNASQNPAVSGSPDKLVDLFDRQELIERTLRYKEAQARERAEADEITVFQLTQRERRILREGNKDEIRAFTESLILRFATELRPGGQEAGIITRQVEGKFNDMITVLAARTNLSNLSKEDKAVELAYLTNMGKVLQGAPNVATMIESGDPELQKRAGQSANFMDERGGLTVLDQLYTMHDGRVGGLITDLRREMRRALQKNYEKTGSFYVLHEEYTDLPVRIGDNVFMNAVQGVGPYSNLTKLDLATGQRVPMTHAEIREQIDMDIKFAQLAFIITGEASAIYIRGRLPEGTTDFVAGAFLNSQWQDTERYGVFTKTNEKVARDQMEFAAKLRLEEVYGEEVAHEMIGNKRLFNFYVGQNGPDILAPYVQMWWENRAVRGLQMINSLNRYERDYTDRWLTRTGRYPTWSPNGYIEPQNKKVTDKSKSYDVPYGGNPEFGIMLRAFLYRDSISVIKDEHTHQYTETETILRTKGAEYHPEIIFEPFAYQPGLHHEAENAAGDARFMAVFGPENGVARFLDTITVDGYTYREGQHISEFSEEYRRAMKRFDKFQHILRPAMDAIRNARINNANPQQTNFGIADPQVDASLGALQFFVTDVQGNVQMANGQPQTRNLSPDEFHTLIQAMQDQISNHGMAGTLASDPMFENQWYSPLTLVDVPMWMLDGKDLSGQYEHGRSLRSQMGGTNIVGRYLGDVQQLGWKTRAGVIGFIKSPPNSPERFLKIMEEQIVPGIQETRGNEAAHEIELAMLTKYMLMMHPELADMFGLKDGLLGIRGKNTDYRKYYGKQVNSLTREQILTIAEGHIIPGLPPELKKKMRHMLKITDWDQLKRKGGQSLLLFLLTTIFATSGAVFGVLNEGISKGAA